MLDLALGIFFAGISLIGLVVGARWFEMHEWANQLEAYELRLPSRLQLEAIQQWLANIAAATHPPQWSLLPRPPLVFEISATRHGIRYYVLMPPGSSAQFLSGLRAALPGTRITEAPDYRAKRPAFRVAVELKLTSHKRPLGLARAEGVSTALLASLQPVQGDEVITLQWIMTSAGTPPPVPTSAPKTADQGWSSYLVENTPPSDAEAVQALRTKQRTPLLQATGRLGIHAASQARAYALLGRTYSAVHGMNASGVRLVRRWLTVATVSRRLAAFRHPVTTWPLTLNSEELAGLLAMPYGDVSLPGVSTGSARQLPPSTAIPQSGTVIARSNYPGMRERLLTMRPEDRLRHTLVLGPTGSGKSWLLARLILQDIAAGRGVFAIDLKGDLITDVLSRIGGSDAQRLIVIDPARRDFPTGFNILAGAHNEASRELAVDNTLNVFKELWAPFWGPRSDQIMRACLTTLVSARAADGSAFTLVELMPLLTHPAFRRFVTAQPSMPATVRDFWQRYNAMSEAEQVHAIGPILNKVDAFTSRTSIRLLLGQSTGLDLRDIYRKRSVVLVNLAKGTYGSETSNLLGALMVLKLWQATLERVQVPAGQRSPIMAYIDEAQDIVRLPIPLADVFSQARGLGLGLTVAHQYFAQLPDPIRAAELGTVRTQIVFATEYEDARLLERRFAPLTADELTGLEAYEVAARLCVGGQTLSPVTGLTLPLDAVTQDAEQIIAASQQRHGRARADVEAALLGRVEVPTRASSGFGRSDLEASA